MIELDGWNTSLPPTDREIEVNEYGYTRAFYQSPTWWWVSIDSWGMESYSAGPTPTVWREITNDQASPGTST